MPEQGGRDKARGAGLVTRIAIVLLGAVLLEALGNFALHRWQSRELVSVEQTRHIAEQINSAAKIAENASLPERVALVRTLEVEGLALNWVPRSVVTDHSAAQPQLAAMRARLLDFVPALSGREMRLSLLPTAGGGSRDLMGVLRLKDGTYLSFRVSAYLNAPLPFSLEILAHVLLMLLVFGVALGLVRTLIRPLRELAEAADETGRNHAARITPSGPHEVRRVGAAFAAMQSRLLRMIEDNTQALIAVSHDLRTPIQRLRLRTAMLEGEEQKEAIGDDLAAMERFIDATLAYVRSGEDEPPRLLDVAVLVSTIVDDAADMGANVHYIGPETLTLHTRSAALTRVLQNLIDNSRRYANRIEVRLSGADRIRVEIAVDDDGPGIPEAQRAEALQPFHRLDQVPDHNHVQGAGLGLSIVQRIVERQGGTLVLGTAASGGLSVRFSLPAAPDVGPVRSNDTN